LKLTVYKIAKAAGMDVTLEASPPGNPSVRPGDILIQNWQGKGPLAVDFTIVTPSIRNARNAASASESTGSRLDAAAELKLKKSKEVCTAAGWQFLPFVADTYGALRADARSFVGKLIDSLTEKSKHQPEGKLGLQVWQAISAAAVSRAARQLSLEQNAISAGRGLLLQGHGHGQSSNNMLVLAQQKRLSLTTCQPPFRRR
jgi:hypothetical protein